MNVEWIILSQWDVSGRGGETLTAEGLAAAQVAQSLKMVMLKGEYSYGMANLLRGSGLDA